MRIRGHHEGPRPQPGEDDLKYVHTDFERMKKAVEVLGEKALTKPGKAAKIPSPGAEDRDG